MFSSRLLARQVARPKRFWGALSAHSTRQKINALHGSWRSKPEIVDTSYDTDGGQLTYATREDADGDLRRELMEHTDPTHHTAAALFADAANFHAALSAPPEEEIEVSDEDERVRRYVACLPPAYREAWSSDNDMFGAILRSSGPAWFLVNPDIPLARLTYAAEMNHIVATGEADVIELCNGLYEVSSGLSSRSMAWLQHAVAHGALIEADISTAAIPLMLRLDSPLPLRCAVWDPSRRHHALSGVAGDLLTAHAYQRWLGNAPTSSLEVWRKMFSSSTPHLPVSPSEFSTFDRVVVVAPLCASSTGADDGWRPSMLTADDHKLMGVDGFVPDGRLDEHRAEIAWHITEASKLVAEGGTLVFASHSMLPQLTVDACAQALETIASRDGSKNWSLEATPAEEASFFTPYAAPSQSSRLKDAICHAAWMTHPFAQGRFPSRPTGSFHMAITRTGPSADGVTSVLRPVPTEMNWSQLHRRGAIEASPAPVGFDEFIRAVRSTIDGSLTRCVRLALDDPIVSALEETVRSDVLRICVVPDASKAQMLVGVCPEVTIHADGAVWCVPLAMEARGAVLHALQYVDHQLRAV